MTSHVPKQQSDWFLPAIMARGSVDQSLAELERCIEQEKAVLTERQAFVAALRKYFKTSTQVDRVSCLGRRVAKLDKTLQHVLGLMRPEREAAWYRSQTTVGRGPFVSGFYEAPVLQPFAWAESRKVRLQLAQSYEASDFKVFPLGSGPSLWRILVELRSEWSALGQLPAPLPPLRTFLQASSPEASQPLVRSPRHSSQEPLPGALSEHLDAVSLRAYLKKVAESWSRHGDLLDACFRQLWDATSRFFEANQTRSDAAAWREQQSERRKHTTKAVPRPSEDRALRFMGFGEYPTRLTLKQRYLVGS